MKKFSGHIEFGVVSMKKDEDEDVQHIINGVNAWNPIHGITILLLTSVKGN